MDINDTINNLNIKHNEISSNGNELDKLNNEIDFLQKFIPDFFSINGHADGIRKMYDYINNDNCNKKIQCSDVFKASNYYKDYVGGMVEFIKDINELNNETDQQILDPYIDKFNRAKENDSKFVSALYNGTLNEINDVDLNEAVINIEYLIDLIPYMKKLKDKCNCLNSSLNTSCNQTQCNLINECMNLLYSSIRNYCFSVVKEIITTYAKINAVMNEQKEKPIIQKSFVLV